MIDVMKIKEVHMIQIILCLVFYYSQIREVLWKRDDLKFEIGSAWNCSRVRMKFKPRQTPRGTEFNSRTSIFTPSFNKSLSDYIK